MGTEEELVRKLLKQSPPAGKPPAHPLAKRELVPFTLQQLARTYTDEALETIVSIMQNGEEAASTRLEAAKVLLDRGWGKPTVQIKQETIKYTISDLTKALEQSSEKMIAQMEEAKRLENDGLAKYITVDATVISDPAADSK